MYRAGIDIGGTQIRAAFFDGAFSIVDRVEFPNDREQSPEQNIDKIVAFINAFLKGKSSADKNGAGKNNADKNAAACPGIGIGCPGPLDFAGGRVLNPPNLYGWNGFELAAYVEKKTGLRAVLNNDANCAGLAEARIGAGRGRSSVFYITVSTGIGGAYIYRGELVNGAHSSAAEVYNLMVCEDSYSHQGANAGSLNEVCGGDALARQAGEVFGRPVDAKELYDELYLARRDPGAVTIIETWFTHLAKGIANIACVVDPDMFIMGGSISLKSPGFLETLAGKAKPFLIHGESLRIEKAMLGGDAGLIGAAMLTEA